MTEKSKSITLKIKSQKLIQSCQSSDISALEIFWQMVSVHCLSLSISTIDLNMHTEINVLILENKICRSH